MIKRVFTTFLATCFTLPLVSWGVTGHRTIGKIAEKHLSPEAGAAVRDLLGNESLADVSTYADQVRSQESYKYTAPWHYINMPSGLGQEDFNQEVLSQQKDNPCVTGSIPVGTTTQKSLSHTKGFFYCLKNAFTASECCFY